MMKKILVLLIIGLPAVLVSAQYQSPLVFIGENGKLEYAEYANTGETEQINTVPDFSWAGYKKGGIQLPVVLAVDTLTPVEGDNTPQIQQAIDAVSALPVNVEGIRGAIFLKAGKYECNSPLFINTSGVILRGEGQLPATNGGTQLVSMAKYQHDFITIEGSASTAISSSINIDTIFVPQQHDTIDGKFWLSANVLKAVQSEQEGDKVMSLRFEANNGDFSAYDSKEGDHKPHISIHYVLTDPEKDTMLTIFPVDDSYVRGGEFSGDNFGADQELIIKNAGEGNRVTRIFYMKFELPRIEAEIKKAEMWLWCRNAGNTSVQENYISLVSIDNWEENTITYDNQPSFVKKNPRITSNFVPVGANSFEIENASNFQVGDLITVLRTPNQAWIDDIQMEQYGWTADSYRIGYERTITGIDSNQIEIDIPMVQMIEAKYGGGEIFKIENSRRTQNCAIENMWISSYFKFEQDEEHGWIAIKLNHTENCWVKNVTAQYFGYGCIQLDWAMNTTVEECAMLDPKSITTGSRKYSFSINKGSFNLFQRCYTRGGRHDFATGSRVAGPNVFVDGYSEVTFADIGPHHRYATGILFDNIFGGEIRVQNRKEMGSGHGWAGAQVMFWNNKGVGIGNEIKVESPIGAMNWGIGCTGPIKSGAGYWDNWGNTVFPRSLYLKQLEDRLGEKALTNIASEAQKEGNIWSILTLWKGIGSIQSSNAFLTDIKVNGIPVPDFSQYKTNYVINVPAGDTEVPIVTYTLSDTLATDEVSVADSLPGNTKITVTAQNGLIKQTYTLEFAIITAVNNLPEKKARIFPNPADSKLYVELENISTDENYAIYSIEGKMHLSGTLKSPKSSVDISHLTPGIYFLKIKNQNVSMKFIKQD